jgi:methionyl aminopeptidase
MTSTPETDTNRNFEHTMSSEAQDSKAYPQNTESSSPHSESAVGTKQKPQNKKNIAKEANPALNSTTNATVASNHEDGVGANDTERRAAPKKKKKKKKPKAPTLPTTDTSHTQENSASSTASVGSTKTPSSHSTTSAASDSVASATCSSELPTVPVSKIFKGQYPVGEEFEYSGTNAWRSTSQEKKEQERLLNETVYAHLRRGAEVHRRVRRWARATLLKPGTSLLDIVRGVESAVWRLVERDPQQPLLAGSAFPTGVSLNHIAAHFTPNSNDSTILTEKDVLKLDFGVHVQGYIIDCAFTVAFDPVFDPLLRAVKEATNTGIKHAGIDARLGEIGEAIQEVMESYEVQMGGKVYPVKAIRNLNGHSIEPYIIHAGKSVPIVKSGDMTKMEENELYAIETFGSTGQGRVNEGAECSHYMKLPDAPRVQLRSAQAKQLLHHINQNYGTLCFCRRWLDDQGQTRHIMALKQLVDSGIVRPYPPLCDVKGCYTAQFEHTLVLRPTRKEVLTRGDDY